MAERVSDLDAFAGNGNRIPSGVIRQAEAVASNQSQATGSAQAGASSGPENLGKFSNLQKKGAGAEYSDHDPPHFNVGSERAAPTRGPGDFLYEGTIEDAPPPEYSANYGLVDLNQAGLNTRANVANDGRVDIHINQKSRRLTNLLVPALRSQLNLRRVDEPPEPPPGYIPPSLAGLHGQTPPPPMNVVIQVVGSRGDIQPFISLGKILKGIYGHRVRLATHPVFRGFIEENGLEFFSIGGDPAELMAFMVKNPGLMPGKDALRSGDIGRRRKGMYEIVKGCWRSCFEAGDGTGLEVSDNDLNHRRSYNNGPAVPDDRADQPFVADAIIANPPSFAHIHCAEKLGIPLHLMFTMPWSPTQAFPHPLANIQSSNAEDSMTNFISYALVEMMTWQGLGDVINRFREKSLGLEPVSLMWAPGMASRLRIPYTYCWSPALIPKPKDWGRHISISGFYFLSHAANYTPADDLKAFLDAGPPPIYIGFGSIVLDDPDGMTKLIFEAVKETGQRAVVSKGWGGFGADTSAIPEGIFMLGNVPHDWLFKHVSCVVHHGGAGTTAAGIALGKPTVIVPFFGDQPFWGAMIAKAGAGPSPIPNKILTSSKLAAAIMQALEPLTLQHAQELGGQIRSERGAETGAQKFHDALDVDSLRCALAPSRTAVWRVKSTKTRLSAFSAAALGNEGLLDFNDLELYRPKELESEDGPLEPISGGASALLGTIGSLMMGVADFPVDLFQSLSGRISADTHLGDSTSTALTANSSGLDFGAEQSNKTSMSTEFSQSRSDTPFSNNQLGLGHETSRPITSDSPRMSSLNAQHAMLPQASSSESFVEATSMGGCRASDNDSKALSKGLTKITSHNESTDKYLSKSDSGVVHEISLDTALGTGKGVGRIVGAGLKSPMEFTLSLAKGFHNAPKLYGDESVRQPDRITGFQSGIRAAGKEFGFGFYDGITGLVTQPLEGAKKQGMAGLVKGVAKGIGGVVLKPGAAIWGIPGYTFKGIYKELQKHLGASVQNYIIAARTAQGYEDWRLSSPEERLGVVSRWHAAQIELSKQKTQRGQRPSTLREHPDTGRKGSKQLKQDTQRKSKYSKGVQARDEGAIYQERSPPAASVPEETSLEEAIRQSVEATSTGNAEEDIMIEKAIRASVAELQTTPTKGDDNDALERAIQASLRQAKQPRSNNIPPDALPTSTIEHDEDLGRALRMSLQNYNDQSDSEGLHVCHDRDDSGVDTDEDENIKLALEHSRLPASSPPAYHDDTLQRALEVSRQERQDREDGKEVARSEEDIVLEYIKKQSLAEAAHRQAMTQTGKPDR
ncbi:hypothetical protein MMC26_007676 [Xylographa opegraphella]|nr:hypothetical protein [Xylographa opegraphella]